MAYKTTLSVEMQLHIVDCFLGKRLHQEEMKLAREPQKQYLTIKHFR